MAASVPVVFIVSDGAGDTAEFVVRAAAAQFYPTPIDMRKVPFVESIASIERVLHMAEQQQGIIAFTLVIAELKQYLLEESAKRNIQCVDVLGPMINNLAAYLNREASHQPGMIHPLDEHYFQRIEAIEFAVKYDDGRDFQGILQADIVLIGVSRTSKTPLSMYLAHQKYKVANVPLVPEIKPPPQLFTVNKDKVFGLTIRAEHLNVIRKERLKSLGLTANARYAHVERINEELAYADRIMTKLNCAVIDVSNKAVEETAALIIDQMQAKKKMEFLE